MNQLLVLAYKNIQINFIYKYKKNKNMFKYFLLI